MIEIDFQEEYNKPIVLYNGCFKKYDNGFTWIFLSFS